MISIVWYPNSIYITVNRYNSLYHVYKVQRKSFSSSRVKLICPNSCFILFDIYINKKTTLIMTHLSLNCKRIIFDIFIIMFLLISPNLSLSYQLPQSNHNSPMPLITAFVISTIITVNISYLHYCHGSHWQVSTLSYCDRHIHGALASRCQPHHGHLWLSPSTPC